MFRISIHKYSFLLVHRVVTPFSVRKGLSKGELNIGPNGLHDLAEVLGYGGIVGPLD